MIVHLTRIIHEHFCCNRRCLTQARRARLAGKARQAGTGLTRHASLAPRACRAPLPSPSPIVWGRERGRTVMNNAGQRLRGEWNECLPSRLVPLAPRLASFRSESTLLAREEVAYVSSFQLQVHFQPRPFPHEHRPRPSRFSCRVLSRLACC